LDTHLATHNNRRFVSLHFSADFSYTVFALVFPGRANGSISAFFDNRGRRRYSLRLETCRGQRSRRAKKRGKQQEETDTTGWRDLFDSSLPHIIIHISCQRQLLFHLLNNGKMIRGWVMRHGWDNCFWDKDGLHGLPERRAWRSLICND